MQCPFAGSTVRKVLRTEVLFNASKSVNELGLTYRPLEETLRHTADSVSKRNFLTKLYSNKENRGNIRIISIEMTFFQAIGCELVDGRASR